MLGHASCRCRRSPSATWCRGRPYPRAGPGSTGSSAGSGGCARCRRHAVVRFQFSTMCAEALRFWSSRCRRRLRPLAWPGAPRRSAGRLARCRDVRLGRGGRPSMLALIGRAAWRSTASPRRRPGTPSKECQGRQLCPAASPTMRAGSAPSRRAKLACSVARLDSASARRAGLRRRRGRRWPFTRDWICRNAAVLQCS